MSEWISVKDKLPEDSGEYLVYLKGEYGDKIVKARFLNKTSKWKAAESYAIFENVSHWMSLPEPPKNKSFAEDYLDRFSKENNSTMSVPTVNLYKSFNDFMHKTGHDFEKAFEGARKATEKAMKNEMPKPESGMLVKLDVDDELYMITYASPLNKKISIQYIHDSDSENSVPFSEIEAIYEYNNCDTGIDVSGKETEKSLIYKKVWERPKVKEISKKIAELMLTEKLNEPVKITEV